MNPSHKSQVINSYKARRQAGASLVEALIFIVIGAIVVAGVVGLGIKVFGANNEKRTNDQVIEISTSIRNVFAGQQSFGAANANLLATLAAAKSLPSDVGTTGAGAAMTAGNVYGGALKVNVAAATNQYVIENDGLDDDACLKIATKAQPGWVSLKINANAAITSLPVPVTTATTQCNAGDGLNVVVWTGR